MLRHAPPVVLDGPPVEDIGRLFDAEQVSEVLRDVAGKMKSAAAFGADGGMEFQAAVVNPELLAVSIVAGIFSARGMPPPEYVHALCYTAGCFHRPHCDGNIDTAYGWRGIVVSLCDPADYTGGDLVIMRGPTSGRRRIRMVSGDAVLIRGDVVHRVETVLSGERRTLTAFSKVRSVSP